ncbi:MAG TPA: ribonuclease R [Trueperaceae bacterium]|nr:ribonuclease R [Trueperaceae bacterium]
MAELDKEQVFHFFQSNPERPWHVQDVQKRLDVDDRNALRKLLSELADEGRLIRTRRRTFGLPQEMNLFLGKLQVTSGGYGFVIPDSGGGKDLFIPADRLSGAWDGDRVLARPNPMAKDGDRQSGEIVRILERGYDKVVGTLEYARGYAILRPDSPRLRERILLTPESVGKLEGGSRIVARMVWPETSGEKEPFGEVEEFLGSGDDPEVETKAVIVKYGLKAEFDPDTTAEARAVPPTVGGDMMEGRTDYRHVNTFTIDGQDAKDFDDALSLERLNGGGKDGLLRVGVHIADVSYYVAESTSLDAEARERATSVYLPGSTLPMLPESLSNGICSLVEAEPRLALSVFVDVTRGGEVKGVRFRETVIQSDARLTYEQVQEYSDGGRLPHGKRKLERDIKVLINLSQELRKERIGAGALDFDFTEAKVDVDEHGALHLTPVRSNTARQLIEEMMLLANRLVAEELDRKDVPALYRVHEDPSEEKVEALQKALGRLGYTLDLQHAKPQDLQRILREAAGKPEAQIVNTLLLRSLKQARYSSENLGHFGLAFENYLHFTSPIRRYPDLVVHRVMRVLLQHRLSPTLRERLKTDFPKLAEQSSERERRAESAERDLTRYYHARWAKEHVGESFQGVVSGVTNFGVFVALPNAVEGLMHVSHLDDDYYIYLEDSLMLMGKHTRKRFRLGDRIEVKVLQANPTQRQIDLIPASMEMPEVEVEEKPQRQKPPKNLKAPAAYVAEQGAEKGAGKRAGRGGGRAAAKGAGGNGRAGTAAGGKAAGGKAAGGKAAGGKATGEKAAGEKAAGEKAAGGRPSGGRSGTRRASKEAASKGAVSKGAVSKGAVSKEAAPKEAASEKGAAKGGRAKRGTGTQGAGKQGAGGRAAKAPDAKAPAVKGGASGGEASQGKEASAQAGQTKSRRSRRSRSGRGASKQAGDQQAKGGDQQAPANDAGRGGPGRGGAGESGTGEAPDRRGGGRSTSDRRARPERPQQGGSDAGGGKGGRRAKRRLVFGRTDKE